MRPYLSIILEKVDEYLPMLPLTLIDLDHHLSKLDISYEVLILAKDKRNHEIADKFAKLVKKNVFRTFPDRISAEDIKGHTCLVFRTNFISEFESFSNLVQSMNSKENTDGYELVFGAIKDESSGSGAFDKLGRLLGSPIDLRFNHPVIGFTKNVAPAILSLSKSNDIHLAMLAEKQGFIVGELPVRFRSGEAQFSSTEKKLGLLFELIKIKILGIEGLKQTQRAKN